MGIKAFTKFLRDKHPTQFIQSHISEFTQKKVGIESHLFLFKFKCAQFSKYRNLDTNWRVQMMYFLLSMRKHNVHPVVVFEGNSKPSAKSDTVQKRIDDREKVKKRMLLLNELKDLLINKKDVNPVVNELKTVSQDISIFPELFKKISKRSSSSNDKEESDGDEVNETRMSKRDILLTQHPALKVIDDEIEKLEKRVVNISKQDLQDLKLICDGIGISNIVATCEAEAYLCRLLHANKIDAVMTDDSDVCAYGCDVWLTKYSSGDGTVLTLNTSELIKEMGITSDQFMDLCVMSGCDYCENVKGLGPVKLLKLIKNNNEHKKYWNDDFESAKEIFLNQGLEKVYPNIEWCKIPSLKTIKNMLQKIGCDKSPKYIRSFLCSNVTLIDEEKIINDEVDNESVNDGMFVDDLEN